MFLPEAEDTLSQRPFFLHRGWVSACPWPGPGGKPGTRLQRGGLLPSTWQQVGRKPLCILPAHIQGFRGLWTCPGNLSSLLHHMFQPSVKPTSLLAGILLPRGLGVTPGFLPALLAASRGTDLLQPLAGGPRGSGKLLQDVETPTEP